jgi:periplasmic protein CpxP/Spy
MKKKIQALAVCAIFGIGMAMAAPIAQDSQAAPQTNTQSQHRQRDPHQQLQFMTKKLNLDADQQKQLLPILTDRQQQIEAIRADNTLSKKDRREKIRSVMQDSRSKIEAVLNDTQKQEWNQMRQHNHEHKTENSTNQG